MLKKRNLIFFSLLILGVFLITSCLPKPPVTEGILKGQVIVPESSKQTKDLTGQALPDATVNIIDPATGDIIATTTTDADGYYQVFVPAGGPYLLEAIKDGVKLQQVTPQVEVGIEYDLGTADCSTTSVALIAQAMLDAEDYPDNLADINLSDIETDPDYNDVMGDVCSKISAGEDPALSAVVQQAVEDFLHPPAPTPTPTPSPTPTPTYNITFNKNDDAAAGSMSAQTIASGSSANLTTCGFSKTGWGFAGWATTSTGAVAYANQASYTMGTANVTLYAKWNINTFTLTYTAGSNGSITGTSPQTVNYGSDGSEVTAVPETNYHFVKWSDDVMTASRTDTNVTSDISVTATFAINSYTVTFDKNGGDIEANPTTKIATHGGNVGTLPAAPTKADYNFSDWYTESDGSGTEFTATTEVIADITVYAKWIHATSYALRATGPAGGWIFYDNGCYSDVWKGQYLEAAPNDQTDRAWGTYDYTVAGADGTAIGTGQQNTLDIINEDTSSSNKAADECAAYSGGDFNDWFLPSKNELNKMYVNLKSGTDENSDTYTPVDGFADNNYWSSSEKDACDAWYQSFYNGDQYYGYKSGTVRVRAVRAF